MTPDRRPLHAVLPNGAGDAARLLEPLARALDGSGPRSCLVDASLPAARIRQLIDAFGPDAVVDQKAKYAHVRDPRERTGHRGHHRHLGVHRGAQGGRAERGGAQPSARASLARAGARPGERWLACLPVSHVAGLQVLVRSLVGGTEPVIAAEATARAWTTPRTPGARTCRSSRRNWSGCLASRAGPRRSPGTGGCSSAARRPARRYSTEARAAGVRRGHHLRHERDLRRVRVRRGAPRRGDGQGGRGRPAADLRSGADEPLSRQARPDGGRRWRTGSSSRPTWATSARTAGSWSGAGPTT